tara:strand:+ start:11559 stop:12158 length:600 start_codon:yes stop_codon:yes gene_type:complete
MLEVSNLGCNLSEINIFQDINFHLNSEENIEVIGENGSGKTTLLKAIVGLVPEVDGEIRWHGELIQSLFYPQCFYQGHLLAVKNNLTVLENLRLFMPEKRDIFSLKQALERVEMLDYINRFCSDLSAGQVRRVAMARWILNIKPLYIIDEPLTALDDPSILLFSKIVEDLNNMGSSFIVTGHRPFNTENKIINLSQYEA